MSQIQDSNPDVARCASVVMGLPNGLRSAEIAALLVTFSKDKVNRLLTINRRLGVLKLYGALWVEPQFYDALRDDEIAEAKILKKMREAKRMLVKKLKARESPPRNANRLHAPNSVFQLAEFMGLRIV
jgi:hypothetical protein